MFHLGKWQYKYLKWLSLILMVDSYDRSKFNTSLKRSLSEDSLISKEDKQGIDLVINFGSLNGNIIFRFACNV